jgi:hypothetical protein
MVQSSDQFLCKKHRLVNITYLHDTGNAHNKPAGWRALGRVVELQNHFFTYA